MPRSPLSLAILVSLAIGCAPAQLVRTERIGPGEECAAGGLAVHLGTDINIDGLLGNDEITTTDYVCNVGAGLGPGQPLVEVAAEPAGENCPDGGIVVSSGIDEDGDGTLDGGKLLDTQYVCNGASGVAGLVRIYDSSLTTLDGLQQLTTVEGDVSITGNPDLVDISGLVGLTAVGGGIQITSNPLLCQSDVDEWLAGVAVGGNILTADNGGC